MYFPSIIAAESRINADLRSSASDIFCENKLLQEKCLAYFFMFGITSYNGTKSSIACAAQYRMAIEQLPDGYSNLHIEISMNIETIYRTSIPYYRTVVDC